MGRLVLAAMVAAVASGVPPATSAQSTLGARIATIGVADQPIEQVFGEIADVEVDSLGQIYVLDGYSKDIRVFDRSFRYLRTLGRPGRGPEEFSGWILASPYSQGTLLVIDPGNVRITRIDPGPEPSLYGGVRVPAIPTGVCSIGARIFLLDNRGENLIAEVASGGEGVSRFGIREQPTGTLRQMLRDHDHFLNQGSLGCDEPTGYVLLSHSFHPVVRAFAGSEEKWRMELADYRQQVFRRGPDGSCCVYLIPNPESNTYHVALDVVSPGDGFAYVTLRESGPQTREGRYEIRVIDVARGREVGRFPSGGVLSAVRDGRGYVIEPYPVPQVHVHLWSPRL